MVFGQLAGGRKWCGGAFSYYAAAVFSQPWRYGRGRCEAGTGAGAVARRAAGAGLPASGLRGRWRRWRHAACLRTRQPQAGAAVWAVFVSGGGGGTFLGQGASCLVLGTFLIICRFVFRESDENEFFY